MFNRAMFLQVEDRCEHLGDEPEFSFSPHKDIMVPGHLDHWRVSELKRYSKPFAERDILATFFGRNAFMAQSYQNVAFFFPQKHCLFQLKKELDKK